MSTSNKTTGDLLKDTPQENMGTYLKRTWRVWVLISCVLVSLALSFWLGAASACSNGGGVLYKGGCYGTNVIDTVEVCEMKDGVAKTCNQFVPITTDTGVAIP